MYRQFNIQQFSVLPTQCVYVFCVDLRTNSHYFPVKINWLVCITKTECVYCAVRTGSLNVIQVNLSLYWAIPFLQCFPVTCLTQREVTDYLGEHSSNVPGTPQLHWCAERIQLWYHLKIQVLLIVTPCRLVHSLLAFPSVVVALYSVLSRPRTLPVYTRSQPRWL